MTVAVDFPAAHNEFTILCRYSISLNIPMIIISCLNYWMNYGMYCLFQTRYTLITSVRLKERWISDHDSEACDHLCYHAVAI